MTAKADRKLPRPPIYTGDSMLLVMATIRRPMQA